MLQQAIANSLKTNGKVSSLSKKEYIKKKTNRNFRT